MKLPELKAELKELYALIEAPADDGYWPEVQERINEIQDLIKAYVKPHTERIRPPARKGNKHRKADTQ